MTQLHTWDDTLPNRTRLPKDVYFVFGANLRGRHGAGAALTAVQHFGAIEGQAQGLMGQSYGIATRDYYIKTLPLAAISKNIQSFIGFSHMHPNLRFFITPIGCGHAGYEPHQIAPLFYGIRDNCAIPLSWMQFFPNTEYFDSGV